MPGPGGACPMSRVFGSSSARARLRGAEARVRRARLFVCSPSHSTVAAGRDVGRRPRPAPCARRGTWSRLPRTTSGWLLNISKAGGSTTCPGNRRQCRSHPRGEEGFPDGQRCPLPLLLSLGITRKSLALSSLCPPFWYLYTLVRPPEPSLLQAEQSQPFLVREMLQPLNHLLWPFVGLSPVCPCCSCTGMLRTGHRTAGVA